MRNILLAATAAITLGATPALAQDEEQRGFYGQLNAGLTSLNDLDLTFVDVDGAGTNVGISAGTKNAFEFGGALGYDFGLVRTEVELAYSRARNNSLTLKKIGGVAVPANSLQGLVDVGIETNVIDLTDATNVKVNGNTVTYDNGAKLRRLSALANLWLDIPVGGSGISPYVGGGLGIQGSEIEGEGKATFAWQLGAGVAIPVGSSFAITADYRYRQQSGYTLNEDGFVYARIGKAKSSSFQLGLRAYF
ncbi:MAG: outer membrane beta-barrel protein [Novosphingobium sp.]|jgi:opacity protein-like surface antigen|nr:outer membrane beta-barrel protein [Novosphingobium sp.]